MAQPHEVVPQSSDPEEPKDFVPIKPPIGGNPFLAGEIMSIIDFNARRTLAQRGDTQKK